VRSFTVCERLDAVRERLFEVIGAKKEFVLKKNKAKERYFS